ncbi:thioredoxin family protein [Streptacidiphilus neutrinimicus]|uniref:thioredoxin family protein n=1 Tax=Streptacidiphilus neutrinimicus TaxID=105420 RepID=UPI0005AB70BB|nr:thioredoxin domain-containing protein [Streptacidiphilus neutrinimicus]
MTQSSEHVAAVTDADFDARVLASELPVLVEFTADWCPPCRMMAPVLAELAAERAADLRVFALDVDTNPGTQGRYGVLSMPTLMLFRSGEPVWTAVGARAKRRLGQEVTEALERCGVPGGGASA